MTALKMRWSAWRLRLEIALWRHGLVWAGVLALVLLAVVLRVIVLPGALAQVDEARAEWVQARVQQEQRRSAQGKADQPTTDQSVVSDLMQVTYAEAEVSAVLRRITQVARAKGLVLAQSEFQASAEGHGGLRQMQVTLPLRAGYPQVRQFMESALLEFPGVSVDQLILKRETVAQNQPEIRLRLTLWVNPAKTRQEQP